MKGFYSVSPSHTIDQCHPYYLSPLSLCFIHSQVSPEHTVVLAPVIHTILIVQIFAHTDIKSFSPYFHNCEHKYDLTYEFVFC